MVDSKKKTVSRGNGTWILKDGSLVPFFEGDEVPDNLADGQLEHKSKAGVFDGPAEPDWVTLTGIGISPADPETREQAAAQLMDAQTSPDDAK
jgi:hypothetical protein